MAVLHDVPAQPAQPMRQLCIRNSAVASYSYVVYLTVALLVLGALWGVWSCSPNSSVKLVTLNKVGQLGQPGLRHQQHVLEHPALAAVSKKVNCTAALRSEEQYRLADLPLLQYSDTGGKPLLLHNHSWAIMNWITTDPGERKVHDIFRHLFSKGCGTSNVFVDVGANAGFYSVLAAAYGCQVVAFDPQPACAQLLECNMCLNAHYASMASGAHGVALVSRPVSDVAGVSISMTVSGTAAQPICDGQFSVYQHQSAAVASTSASGNATAAAAAPAATFNTTAVSLDDLLLDSHLHLHVVKIDTEGYELSVLKSMRQLLATKRVAYILVEVTPLFWARDGLAREDVYNEFSGLLRLHCTIQRAMDVNFSDDKNIATLLDTEEKLREYLVLREFVQEDLLVSCPGA